MSQMFQSVDGFRAYVQMLSTQTQIPLKPDEAAMICAAIGSGYTYLTLRNVWGFEVVKATCSSGAVIIERGTKPVGGDVCVAFEWTKPAMADFIAQGAGGAAPAICSVEAASARVQVEMDGCTAKIDRSPCQGALWRSGNKELIQEDHGCIWSRDVPSSVALPHGTFKNATITVDEFGNIVSIAQGDNIVFTGGGCCTCQGGATAA